jgi:isocitrate lyase
MTDNVLRPYTQADVKRLRGRTKVIHSLAGNGAWRLRVLLHRAEPTRALGAMTGNQAVQMVKAGLLAIYASGWQVAADANTSGQTYPDQSLYAVDSVPALVRRINNALLRAEQIDALDDDKDLSKPYKHWLAPIVADAEAGFGGPLNAYELVKALIEAGAAGIHLEDQLSSAKKCGHLGGKVLVPTSQAIQNLVAARLAADVLEVPTVIIARTDALSAELITSDIDERDQPFIARRCHPADGAMEPVRTSEGFYRLTGDPMERCVARGLAYAPYADLLWFETSEPNLAQARAFADRIRAKFPGKKLAYNCSPSFAWSKKLSASEIASFQDELGKMGYAFQFVTLAGWHAVSHSTFDLAYDYNRRGMAAYASFQDHEFESQVEGYTAVKHQREAGTSYFDAVAQAISGGTSSTLAMHGSTEASQFAEHMSPDGIGSGHAPAQEEAGSPRAGDPGAQANGEPEADAVRAAPLAGPVQHLAATSSQADGEPGAGSC